MPVGIRVLIETGVVTPISKIEGVCDAGTMRILANITFMETERNVQPYVLPREDRPTKKGRFLNRKRPIG